MSVASPSVAPPHRAPEHLVPNGDYLACTRGGDYCPSRHGRAWFPISVFEACDRRVGRNRTRISHKRGRFRRDPLERAFVIEEFIQPAPNRRFHVVRTTIAHVRVLIPCL